MFSSLLKYTKNSIQIMKYVEELLRNIWRTLANVMEKVKSLKKSAYVVRRKDAKHFSPSENKINSLLNWRKWKKQQWSKFVSHSEVSLVLVQWSEQILQNEPAEQDILLQIGLILSRRLRWSIWTSLKNWRNRCNSPNWRVVIPREA